MNKTITVDQINKVINSIKKFPAEDVMEVILLLGNLPDAESVKPQEKK
jgi:hypothetical protein